jgi:predicted GNAT family acetyltransferase
MFTRPTRLRPLRASGAQGAADLALSDPVVNALAGARLMEMRRSMNLGQEFGVIGPEQAPDGVLWHGVNLSPISATRPALESFGAWAASRSRRASSVVGDRAQVELLWSQLMPTWGPAVREYRWSQPVMVATGGGSGYVAGTARRSTGVRAAVRGEEELIYPAAVAMFREEVGSDPTAADGGRGFHARVRDLVATGRTYLVVREGRVVFKADVGALFGPVAQIHGVWVDPEMRGRGIARTAMREVVPLIQRDHAPQVSLYVNSFNTAARAAYRAAGFVDVAELSTILF